MHTPNSPPTLAERFAGCLLGLAVGDALGGCFEAQSSEWIARDSSNRARIRATSGPNSVAADAIQSHNVERDSRTPLRATIPTCRFSGR